MSKIKTNGSLTKLSSPSLIHKDMNGTTFDFHQHRRTSNCSDGSDDDLLSIGVHSGSVVDGTNDGTIKRQPLSNSTSMPMFSATHGRNQTSPVVSRLISSPGFTVSSTQSGLSSNSCSLPSSPQIVCPTGSPGLLSSSGSNDMSSARNVYWQNSGSSSNTKTR